MEEKKQFKNNFFWNVLGTGLNAFNSLFFMIIVTRINGIDEAGIFTIAFSTACILFSVGIYAGRIYQVTELNKDITDIDFIFSRIITCIIMVISVILFSMINKYDINKTLIFLLLTIYKVIEAFCDVFYGILQKNEKLDVVGKSLFLKAIMSILAFLVIDLISQNIIISIILADIICIIITILYDFKKIFKYLNFKDKVKIKNVIYIFKKGFFVFAISFLGIYILNAPKYAIDRYLPSNVQTIFGIIVMPATVVGLVAQFLIHPYLNKLLKLYEQRDLIKFNKLINKIIFFIMLFGLIGALLGYFIGTEVLQIIYGIELRQYKIDLAIIIISATLYAVGTIYSSVLTTVRKTFSQFIIYNIISVFALIFSNILTKFFEIKGSIIAYFLIMLMQSMAYLIYTKINIKKIFENNSKGR